MRVLLFASQKTFNEARTFLEKSGIVLVEKNPEYVISYGGDGTLMRAEAAYPGIPKLVLKGSLICKKCAPFSNEEIIRRFVAGKYTIETMMKLEASANHKTLVGLNDIIMHNVDPRHAIRYRVRLNEKEIPREIIGDGVVVSTPFGSTAYFRSITDSTFETGIGLAFNNSTERVDHQILAEDTVIVMAIVRGPAVVFADNHQESIDLQEGDEVIIKKAAESAKIIKM